MTSVFEEPAFLGYYCSAASIYNIFDLKVPPSQLSRYAIKYPKMSVSDSGQFAATDSTFTSPWIGFFRADFPFTDTHIMSYIYRIFPFQGNGHYYIIKNVHF